MRGVEDYMPLRGRKKVVEKEDFFVTGRKVSATALTSRKDVENSIVMFILCSYRLSLKEAVLFCFLNGVRNLSSKARIGNRRYLMLWEPTRPRIIAQSRQHMNPRSH